MHACEDKSLIGQDCSIGISWARCYAARCTHCKTSVAASALPVGVPDAKWPRGCRGRVPLAQSGSRYNSFLIATWTVSDTEDVL